MSWNKLWRWRGGPGQTAARTTASGQPPIYFRTPPWQMRRSPPTVLRRRRTCRPRPKRSYRRVTAFSAPSSRIFPQLHVAVATRTGLLSLPPAHRRGVRWSMGESGQHAAPICMNSSRFAGSRPGFVAVRRSTGDSLGGQIEWTAVVAPQRVIQRIRYQSRSCGRGTVVSGQVVMSIPRSPPPV